MAIAFSMFVAFYLTGVYLVVSSLTHQNEWQEDENGELHYQPDASVTHR